MTWRWRSPNGSRRKAAQFGRGVPFALHSRSADLKDRYLPETSGAVTTLPTVAAGKRDWEVTLRESLAREAQNKGVNRKELGRWAASSPSEAVF